MTLRLVPTRWLVAALLAVASAPTLAEPAAPEETPKVRSATFRSPVYRIDRVYRSMKGPEARAIVRLGDPARPELLWITGYRTRIVDANAEMGLSAEFMCHANLGFADFRQHRRLLAWRGKPRIFTLSQGQMDVAFPPGFGIPVLSTEPLQLDTQVLNLNPQEQVFEVVHETTVEYVRDADTTTPMKALFQRAAQGLVLVDGSDPYFDLADPDPEQHGPGCMVGAAAGERTLEDRFGREFAAHWVVPPGRQVNRTLVTNWMKVPFDTTIHQIAVHLHPFAEKVMLRDLDTGETVFEARATQSEERVGLAHVESYSSAEGIPVYADHEYELVSVYDNTTDEDQDAMAVMFVYMLDSKFEKPGSFSARER